MKSSNLGWQKVSWRLYSADLKLSSEELIRFEGIEVCMICNDRVARAHDRNLSCTRRPFEMSMLHRQ